MIAVFDRLPVKEGAARQIVERFANSRGHVRGFPGFVSMEVLSSEGTEGADEVADHNALAEPGHLRRLSRE